MALSVHALFPSGPGAEADGPEAPSRGSGRRGEVVEEWKGRCEVGGVGDACDEKRDICGNHLQVGISVVTLITRLRYNTFLEVTLKIITPSPTHALLENNSEISTLYSALTIDSNPPPVSFMPDVPTIVHRQQRGRIL
ncbi:hypothetical protein BDY19DRAFT_910640 [Irpex rosettiformis]|uniref:Uncharacterized protein n=1 Tax=Irpex rosettiformis TaxID=378272 RepID=A0ACB8TN56_9APHY|nr:hypothetical protein BDY19DRAFT_910640 [Irpex rosettiformis]